MSKSNWQETLKSRIKIQTKTSIESWLWKCGFDVHLRRAKGSHKTRDERDYQWLRDFAPQTVLDIGAHVGVYTERFHELFPEATIYAFEPLPKSYDLLAERVGSYSQIHSFNVALGNFDGEMEFYQNEASETSSLLEMSDIHKAAYPHTERETQTKVSVRKLDSYAKEMNLVSPVLAKIDVQGGELDVVKGALRTLEQVDMVIIETSFSELYEKQPLFVDVYKLMTQCGFIYSGSFNQLLHPVSRRVLQQDAIFLKDGFP